MDTEQTTSKGQSCATRYPLLFVHGVALRDGKSNRIWGRIPDALREQGAQVYFGEADAWGTPLNNAVQLMERLPVILEESGATKVNIIAHSKGGLDSRYLIELLKEDLSIDMPIASLTTIATPHHGSLTLEMLFYTFWPLFYPFAFVTNNLYRLAGDENPDVITTCKYLTATHMQQFNADQPNISPVYSQQFAGTVRDSLGDPISIFTNPFVSLLEGPNDGFVAVSSAGYDHYQGEFSALVGSGVSHMRLVDVTQNPYTVNLPPDASESQKHEASAAKAGPSGIPLEHNDIVDFYIALVADLKARGY